MKKILAVVLAMSATQVQSQSKDLLLFGGDGHKDFLGCLTCSEYASNSIWNEFSQYGWKNSFGKWNRFGSFAGAYGSRSACNEYASDPPVIVDRQGNFYGLLSMSEYKRGSVCGGQGSEQLCTALKVMCASD